MLVPLPLHLLPLFIGVGLLFGRWLAAAALAARDAARDPSVLASPVDPMSVFASRFNRGFLRGGFIFLLIPPVLGVAIYITDLRDNHWLDMAERGSELRLQSFYWCTKYPLHLAALMLWQAVACQRLLLLKARDRTFRIALPAMVPLLYLAGWTLVSLAASALLAGPQLVRMAAYALTVFSVYMWRGSAALHLIPRPMLFLLPAAWFIFRSSRQLNRSRSAIFHED